MVSEVVHPKKICVACIEITPVAIITETSSCTLSHSVFLLESLTFCIQVVFLYLFLWQSSEELIFDAAIEGPISWS